MHDNPNLSKFTALSRSPTPPDLSWGAHTRLGIYLTPELSTHLLINDVMSHQPIAPLPSQKIRTSLSSRCFDPVSGYRVELAIDDDPHVPGTHSSDARRPLMSYSTTFDSNWRDAYEIPLQEENAASSVGAVQGSSWGKSNRVSCAVPERRK